MDSLKLRLITAIVAIPAIIFALFMSEKYPLILTIALAIVCALMSYEVISAKKLHKSPIILISSLLFSLVTPLIITTKFSILPVYLFAIILCFTMIIKHEELKLSDITFAFFTNVIITFGLSSILLLSSFLQGYVAFSFVICVAIPWMSDSGAFFAGVFLGKHKLCPKISPKKTIEGFVGGLIAGTLSGVIIGLVFTLIYSDVSFNYIALLVMGFFGSAISVVGDLTFSLIKRSCNIKDYGSLFPGHGGMLDRFDSVILIAPLMYLFCTYFNVVLV